MLNSLISQDKGQNSIQTERGRHMMQTPRHFHIGFDPLEKKWILKDENGQDLSVTKIELKASIDENPSFEIEYYDGEQKTVCIHERFPEFDLIVKLKEDHNE
jgi:hypothetical protein